MHFDDKNIQGASEGVSRSTGGPVELHGSSNVDNKSNFLFLEHQGPSNPNGPSLQQKVHTK